MNAVAAFSYGALNTEAADLARSVAETIRSRHRRFIAEVGRDLLRVRASLPHGAFTSWLRDEVGIEARTARNYMSAAAWLEGKSETISVLPPTLLYELASPKLDADVVAEVVAAADRGEPLSADQVRRRLHQAYIEAQALAAAQRRAPKADQAKLKVRLRQQRKERLAEHERARVEQETKSALAYRTVRPLADRVARVLVGDRDQMVELLRDWRGQQQLVRAMLDAFLDQQGPR